jgi:hypothetical protein
MKENELLQEVYCVCTLLTDESDMLNALHEARAPEKDMAPQLLRRAQQLNWSDVRG